MIIEFCLGWFSAIIFLWLLLNKFDSNGTFSSLFFDNKSLRTTMDSNPYEESFSELEDIIKKSHTLLKELQLSHFQPKEQQKIPKENINNIPKQHSIEQGVKKEQSQSPKKPIVKGKPSVLRNSLSNGFEEENIIELPLRETTVLIRKINKWHKFHATLTNNLINFSIPNQPNVFAKIVLSSGNSNIEILKKSTLGCISITNKKEAVIQPVTNETNNEEYGEFLTFFSQVNTCILRFKSDELAEDWIQQITAVLTKGNEDIDDFEGDDLFSSDEFEENGPIEDITEEIKLPEKEKEDVFLAAKNPQEKKALTVFIRELKGLYDPESHDGYTLMRFLRARQLNIPKAITMFTSYLNWKKEFRPEFVTKDMVISELRKKKGYFHYFDRRKHPSLIVMVGKHVQKDSELSVMLNYIVYILETAIKYMPQSVERFSAIIDCTNLSINQVDFPLVKDGLNILQNYYPERLGGVYITNYPMLFQVVWKVIKPLLDTRTSEKIKFCTPKELLDHYEPKHLPVRLGGTSKFEETDYDLGLETLNDSL